ncbi:hypothetical protein N7508_005129 [Penicillium antarcticum]|uniref:uncharacterized protein n=1 Tax=Penicillium antarcticum TaxID=416450 RepID=UPI00238C0E70|nr:uncharacterized protein N7508_005129 [Penicillium antarcticum]KAJ5306114.1 hypothetical protein N7508_005129 [Penicillium antarcticum]
MPLPATPSPFRLSRRNPSTRRIAGPQFAPTPRFVLSQPTTQENVDDLDVIDDEEGPSSTPNATRQPPASQSALRSRQLRDVIEDSDDTKFISSQGLRGTAVNELPDDAIDSSPPEESEPPGVLDAEFDALFAPTHENKRRRVEGHTPVPSMRQAGFDPTPFSPTTENEAAETVTNDTEPNFVALENDVQRTPAPSARLVAPVISTPASTQTPFRGRPRFMLSSTAKPPISQSAPRFSTSTQETSPPGRRKPTFVLPRSPSPNQEAEDIPAPFSPSSRTLRRRGRKRGGALNYAVGGMAAEVRSWILEMGMTRDSLPKPQIIKTPSTHDINYATVLEKYLVAVRVSHARHSALSSCGPFAFLQAALLGGYSVQEEAQDESTKIMIMGPPRSKPPQFDISRALHLQEGDLVGIYSGLTWDLELGAYLRDAKLSDGPSPASQGEPPGSNGGNNAKERWLVAMEWELIQISE